MSYDNDSGHMIWVSDLDGYVDLDTIFGESDSEQQKIALELELDEVGDIDLFEEKSISSRTLLERGMSPDSWRLFQHEAEKTLAHAHTASQIEAGFLKEIMKIGRRYGVARYGRLEGLPLNNVITATFPHGIRALIYQYMIVEPALADPLARRSVGEVIYSATISNGLIAYQRANLVQQHLHRVATESLGIGGHLQLNKHRMRMILSLCRLYFSTLECNVGTFSELADTNNRYDRLREESRHDHDHVVTGRYICNWKMRHLHPLTFYFPYSVRNALTRATRQTSKGVSPLVRERAVNEIALARCGINLMRTKAIESRKGKY